MPRAYYRIRDDLRYPGRWHLSTPETRIRGIGPAKFTSCLPFRGRTAVTMLHARYGETLDFTLAAFDVPVVSAKCAEIIGAAAGSDVQFIPVGIPACPHGFLIMNVLTEIRCVDECRSEFIRWGPGDDRPEKVGHYRMFTRLRIDPDCIGDKQIFRVDGWDVVLVVSAFLKRRMQEAHLRGCDFRRIS